MAKAKKENTPSTITGGMVAPSPPPADNGRDWFDINDPVTGRGPHADAAPAPPTEPAPPVPTEPTPPVEPVASVPRGTSDATDDDSAPYGRDTEGKPLAPYGYRADGVTPAKKRGRKGADAPPSTPVDPSTPPTDKPKREKKSAAETALAALDSVTQTAEGYWTVDADAARCDRARRNAPDFVDLAEIAIESFEPLMLSTVEKSLVRSGNDAAKVKRIFERIKPMREIRFKFAGKEISVLTGNAESLSFVLAYFLPWKPSHPLLRAVVQMALSYRAYLSHVKDAATAALSASAEP